MLAGGSILFLYADVFLPEKKPRIATSIPNFYLQTRRSYFKRLNALFATERAQQTPFPLSYMLDNHRKEMSYFAAAGRSTSFFDTLFHEWIKERFGIRLEEDELRLSGKIMSLKLGSLDTGSMQVKEEEGHFSLTPLFPEESLEQIRYRPEVILPKSENGRFRLRTRDSKLLVIQVK